MTEGIESAGILLGARLIFFAQEIKRPASASSLFGLSALAAHFDDAALDEILEDRGDSARREHRLGGYIFRVIRARLDYLEDVALIRRQGMQQVAMLRLLLEDRSPDHPKKPCRCRRRAVEHRRPLE